MASGSRRSRLTTISLSPELREALDGLKPRGRSFEDLLELLVRDRGLDGWRERIDLMEETEIAKLKARKARLSGAPGVQRAASEQRMLAEAAGDRWQRWEETGRVSKTGERSWAYEARPHGGSRARVRRVR